MPTLEFVGQSRNDSDSKQSDPSRLVNMYRESTSGDRTKFILKSVLGTVPFAETANVFMRAMYQDKVSGTIYAAVGGFLYSIARSGVSTQIGEITDSVETSISGNNGTVTLVAGGDYYIWDGTTLSQPADGAFSDFGSVDYIGQRTILTERNGRKVQWSDVADPATLDGLSFATTETTDDSNLRVQVINGNLWFFKESSVEIWQLTLTDAVIAPLSGGTLEIGLKAYRLVSKFPDGAFFVGTDNVVYVTAGTGLKPISTLPVETAISQGDPTQVFYYEDEGHKICVVRFSDRPAWCCDLSTGEWHERAEGVQHKPWTAVETVHAYGKWYVATDLGAVHELARVNVDVGVPLLRRAVSRTLTTTARVAKLQLRANTGVNSLQGYMPVYLVDADGVFIVDVDGLNIQAGDVLREIDVMCWIRVSRDAGQTWGYEKFKSMGKLGQYGRPLTWRSLGKGRTGWDILNFEYNCAAPVDVPVFCDAEIDLA